MDLFDFYRWLLCIVATVYTTVITVQSLWGWYVWLAGSDKYMSLLRRYVLLHGLRLRFRAFWGDVLISFLLCVAFLLLWQLHVTLFQNIHNRKQLNELSHVSRLTQQH